MSDLFHEQVPFEFIRKVFSVMEEASWHRFQVLTKRSTRLAELAPLLLWPDNVWMGVTVENADFASRIDALRTVPATVRFLSLEPLLGPMSELNLAGIDWVIVGGESGPGARLMEPAWALDLLRRCRRSGIPFFFKQWGGPNKKKAGRILAGSVYDEMPEVPVRRSRETISG